MPRAPESDEGRIEIEASGPWAEAIFWEVPLLATLSEIYFTTVDKDWNCEGQAGASNLASLFHMQEDLILGVRVPGIRTRV